MPATIDVKRRYLTPRQAADLLGLTRRTVYALLRAGKLEGVRVGRSWRLPREALEPEALRKETGES